MFSNEEKIESAIDSYLSPPALARPSLSALFVRDATNSCDAIDIVTMDFCGVDGRNTLGEAVAVGVKP
jgi:hypothetical protein